MKCVFCNQPVFGSEGITVPNVGPAHQKCYQVDQALRRTFQKLDISALNNTELLELKELVLAEENLRNRANDSDDNCELELF